MTHAFRYAPWTPHTRAIRKVFAETPDKFDPRDYMKPAREAMKKVCIARMTAFGQAGHRVDLSVDGQQLVAVGAPKDPDQLQAYLERLAPVAQAIDQEGLAPHRMAPPPAGFGFYGHPDWQLIGRDDTLIARYGLTTAGFGHTTEKVIRGNNDGLPRAIPTLRAAPEPGP